jgi:hypothetical protein
MEIQQTRIDSGNSQTLVVAWIGLANGDSGAPVPFSQYADKSAQVVGTFGAGGTLRIEGSLDGDNYSALTDPQGNDLDFTEAKIEAISEAVRYVRPRVVGGDGTTLLNVTMLLRGGMTC